LKRGGVLVGVKVQVSPFFWSTVTRWAYPYRQGGTINFTHRSADDLVLLPLRFPLSLPQFKGKVKSVIDSVSSFDDAPIKL
jgi:hypothetical protein